MKGVPVSELRRTFFSLLKHDCREVPKCAIFCSCLVHYLVSSFDYTLANVMTHHIFSPISHLVVWCYFYSTIMAKYQSYSTYFKIYKKCKLGKVPSKLEY